MLCWPCEESAVEKEKIIENALKHLNAVATSQLSVSLDESVCAIDRANASGNDVLTIKKGDIDLRYVIFVQSWAPQKDIDALIAQLKAVQAASFYWPTSLTR